MEKESTSGTAEFDFDPDSSSSGTPETGDVEDVTQDLANTLAYALSPGRNTADPALYAPYPNGLIYDLALETAPVVDILSAYSLSIAQFKAIASNPSFRNEFKTVKKQMKTEGYTFRIKAKAQSEALLATAWSLIHSPDTPAATKAMLIRDTVRWAGLEVKEATETPQSQVRVFINLGDTAADKPIVINGTTIDGN